MRCEAHDPGLPTSSLRAWIPQSQVMALYSCCVHVSPGLGYTAASDGGAILFTKYGIPMLLVLVESS